MAYIIEGGGEPAPVGPWLRVRPLLPNFGDVTIGSSSQIEFTLYNAGDEVGNIADITTDNPDYVVGAFASTINPGSSITVIVTFTPTGAGASNGTLTIESDATNNPFTVPLTGNGIAAGAKALSIDPSSWDFGSQKVAVPSAEKLFTVTNTGTVAVTVSGITFTAPFSAGATFPGAFPVVIAPAGTLIFGIIYTPATDTYELEAAGCSIASDAINNPHDISLSGTGYLIVAAYIVAGVGGLLLAFSNVIKLMDPNDLNCEEAAFFERIHNFHVMGDAGPIVLHDVEKTLLRIRFTYEDLGPAILKVSATVKRAQDVAGVLTQIPQTVNASDTRLGTVAADEWPQIAMADLEIRHELIQIKVLREADGGKVSLIDYTPKFEPQGETVEEK